MSRGYRKPHLVTASGTRARKRSEGFLQEWQAGGHGPVTEAAVEVPSRFGHARRIFADLRRLPDMPDVVVCGSDYLAQGIIVEALASGLRVPEDIAVVGFGNSSIAGEMRPTITSVEVDGARIAREAIAAIRRHGSSPEKMERWVDVGFKLIARESA
jgi:LacI family gluconate utilization system Gnt-I transcriptional repressor